GGGGEKKKKKKKKKNEPFAISHCCCLCLFICLLIGCELLLNKGLSLMNNSTKDILMRTNFVRCEDNCVATQYYKDWNVFLNRVNNLRDYYWHISEQHLDIFWVLIHLYHIATAKVANINAQSKYQLIQEYKKVYFRELNDCEHTRKMCETKSEEMETKGRMTMNDNGEQNGVDDCSDREGRGGKDKEKENDHVCNALGAIVDDGPWSVMKRALIIHSQIALCRFLSAFLTSLAWCIVLFYAFNDVTQSQQQQPSLRAHMAKFGWNRLSSIWHVTILVENVFGFGIVYCWAVFKDLLRMWHFRNLRFDPRLKLTNPGNVLSIQRNNVIDTEIKVTFVKMISALETRKLLDGIFIHDISDIILEFAGWSLDIVIKSILPPHLMEEDAHLLSSS
ncbi:hypothetical protein RFI_17331, partial [Reticulomyxa filosa]